jgi:hypothetical protein
MILRFPSKTLSTRAPGITGAVFCLAIALFSLSCGKKSGTPDWDTPGTSDASTAAEVSPAAAPAATTTPTPQAEPAAASVPATTTTPEAGAEGGRLRFIAYNVENWLTMDRFVDNKPLKDSPKPDSEKQAVVSILVKQTSGLHRAV